MVESIRHSLSGGSLTMPFSNSIDLILTVTLTHTLPTSIP